jgi:FPC/CPF motif-containing protein YcgG
MRAQALASRPDHSDGALIDQFQAFVAAESFPCVGAKSALNRDQMVFEVEHDIRTGPRPTTLTSLQRFSQAYQTDSPLFQSVVVLFRDATMLSEHAFETYLWRYLQRLHDADAASHEWDPTVSKNPDASDFSFSVGGRGYYVVGLHPGASRVARRFSHPALVFNLHDQFERLRDGGKYESIRDTIIQRDTHLEGTRNPMLKQFGTSSEARQYSGRVVDEQWRCPFHAH